jgi:two-component system, OmpR family, sensor kinase
MSSSPPTESSPTDRTGRRPLSGWSLRTRLLATTLGLLALTSTAFAVATEVAVHRVLIARVDGQLADAGNRGMRPFDGPTPGSDDRPTGCAPEDGEDLFPPGQPVGTVVAHIVAGQVCFARVLDRGGTGGHNGVDLPAATFAIFQAVPLDGHAHPVTLTGLGDYRMQASRPPGRTDIVVTGLPLTDVERTLNTLTMVAIAVALAGLVLAGSVGAVMISRELRPLRRMAATATRVSELPLDRGEVALPIRVATADTDPRTEVGQVGSALNRMLGHVATALRVRQASQTRMRQFLADASHELRTPLAAIRGYAELSRRMDGEVPPDVAHAMRRVESEARRMTTLVEDLLLLARLDAGRPLERVEVDLSGLVVDAVSDAHAAGPDHDWQLDLPGEPVVVTGDALRLHQVLANLLANARTHTPPGTRVTVGLAATGDGARLEVADDGPGIPASLMPDVFDRFARADTSRSRAAGSTGLGLAIVAAVVETHQGTVSVASEPGCTVFTVTLPATP